MDNQLEFDFEQYGLNPDLGILSALDQTDGYNLTEVCVLLGVWVCFLLEPEGKLQ